MGKPQGAEMAIAAATAQSQAPRTMAHMMASPKTETSSSRVDAKPNWDFFLRHHPSSWELGKVKGDYWYLPRLVRHTLRVGQGGIRTLQKHEVNTPERAWEDSVRQAQSEGWVYVPTTDIPAQFLPEGVGAGTYKRQLPCYHRRTGASGMFWCEAWNVPLPPRMGLEQEFEFHAEKRDAWRLWLVQTGVIEPPTPAYIERLKQRISARVPRALAMSGPEGFRETQVAAAQAQAKVYAGAKLPARSAA